MMNYQYLLQVKTWNTTAPSSTNTTEEVTAFNASYTSGAASVRTTFSESDNDGGTAGCKEEHMEISLVLSF